MAAGQNLLPDEVKAKRGTLVPGRVNKSKPGVVPGIVPALPKDMPDTNLEVWNRLKKAVEYLGVYADSDYDTFLNMVMCVVASRHVPEDVDINQVIAFRKQALTYLEAFGLTPQSRSKVSTLGQKQAEDELSEFLNS